MKDLFSHVYEMYDKQVRECNYENLNLNIEMSLVRATINNLNWESLSFHDKQSKRVKIVQILERTDLGRENFNYTGYERDITAYYELLLQIRNRIEPELFDEENFLKKRLWALVAMEMRAIDINPRMINIKLKQISMFKPLIEEAINLYEWSVLHDLLVVREKVEVYD